MPTFHRHLALLPHAALALCTMLGVALATAAPAAATVVCGTAGWTPTLLVQMGGWGDTATITRYGNQIRVNGTTCGGNPTIATIQEVNVSGGNGPQSVTISLVGGSFAQGSSFPEGTGTNEIEFNVSLASGTDMMRLQGGPTDDDLSASSSSMSYTNDTDADIALTSVEQSSMFGADGNDVIRLDGLWAGGTWAGGSITRIDGEAGNDYLVPTTAGSEAVCGGPGTDLVSYGGSTAGVTVTLDGAANDGKAGEADNVGCSANDVENVNGSAHNDSITGNSAANVFMAMMGADVLHGAGGDDRFRSGAISDGADSYDGGPGLDTVDYTLSSATVTVTIDGSANDGKAAEGDNVRTTVERVYGGSGYDSLTGNSLTNYLFGYGGNDTIRGAGGKDALYGGNENDTIYARDGVVDTVNGGAGTDRAQIDGGDMRSLIEQILP